MKAGLTILTLTSIRFIFSSGNRYVKFGEERTFNGHHNIKVQDFDIVKQRLGFDNKAFNRRTLLLPNNHQGIEPYDMVMKSAEKTNFLNFKYDVYSSQNFRQKNDLGSDTIQDSKDRFDKLVMKLEDNLKDLFAYQEYLCLNYQKEKKNRREDNNNLFEKKIGFDILKNRGGNKIKNVITNQDNADLSCFNNRVPDIMPMFSSANIKSNNNMENMKITESIYNKNNESIIKLKDIDDIYIQIKTCYDMILKRLDKILEKMQLIIKDLNLEVNPSLNHNNPFFYHETKKTNQPSETKNVTQIAQENIYQHLTTPFIPYAKNSLLKNFKKRKYPTIEILNEKKMKKEDFSNQNQDENRFNPRKHHNIF